MDNIALEITERPSHPIRRPPTTVEHADLFGEPSPTPGTSTGTLGTSPPSFTATLFSCCSGDWAPRHKRREMQSPLFSPRSMPPQNMIIEPMDVSLAY